MREIPVNRPLRKSNIGNAPVNKFSKIEIINEKLPTISNLCLLFTKNVLFTPLSDFLTLLLYFFLLVFDGLLAE
jgi:hypothetical protein